MIGGTAPVLVDSRDTGSSTVTTARAELVIGLGLSSDPSAYQDSGSMYGVST